MPRRRRRACSRRGPDILGQICYLAPSTSSRVKEAVEGVAGSRRRVGRRLQGRRGVEGREEHPLDTTAAELTTNGALSVP